MSASPTKKIPWLTMVKKPWFFGYGKTTWLTMVNHGLNTMVTMVYHGLKTMVTMVYHTQKTMVFLPW